MTTVLTVESQSASITQQDVYPGIQGPVRMIRNYRVQFTASASETVKPVFLYVDSVKVPIRKLIVNGEKSENGEMQGEALAVDFNATRQFPSKGKPIGVGLGAVISEQMLSKLSGERLEGTAMLAYTTGGKTEVVSLGSITVLDDIYAP